MKPETVVEQHPQAKAAISRWDDLRQRRSPFERDWEDIAALIRPQRRGITSDTKGPIQKPLSSEPIMAQSAFASGLYSALTNPASRWFSLETPDSELNAWQPLAQWNDIVTRRIMASFAPAVSGFYSATFQAYSDIAAFGNAAAYDAIDTKNRKFIDVTVSLAEPVVDIDAHGRVCEFVRKFKLTPHAAVREYGAANCPQKLIDLAAKGTNDQIIFYHHVRPNDEYVGGKLGPRGKRFLSITACEIENSLVRYAGFDEMPVYYPRWDVDSGDIYGTGPGHIALPSARMVNLMDHATIRAAQFAADPTILAPDRQAIPLNGTFRPGSMIYGGTNMQGNPLVRPFEFSANIGLTEAEKRAKVEAAKDCFHYAIMSLSGRTGVTEEETRIMEEARLRNWAPHADRVMEEYAARKVERRFNLLWRAGQLPAPPKEAANMPLQVRYQSTAAMAMRAREGQAIRSFVGDLAPLAQIDPRYIERVNPDALIEALHDASPVLPASIMRSREEADQIAQARMQQQQQMQALQMAQAGGSAAKDFAAAMGPMM